MFLKVCKQSFHISRAYISESKRCFNVKPSAYYFHMKTNILADFQTCIIVPLTNEWMSEWMNEWILCIKRIQIGSIYCWHSYIAFIYCSSSCWQITNFCKIKIASSMLSFLFQAVYWWFTLPLFSNIYHLVLWNHLWYPWPTGSCMFKVNDRNIKTKCEICLKLTLKTPERRQWHRSSAFIVNFEHISGFVLVFLLLTLSR